MKIPSNMDNKKKTKQNETKSERKNSSEKKINFLTHRQIF